MTVPIDLSSLAYEPWLRQVFDHPVGLHGSKLDPWYAEWVKQCRDGTVM